MHIHIHTPTHAILLLLKKSTAEWSSNRLQKRTRWQSFHPPTLGNQTPGFCGVLSVAAPFDSVADADVLGAEDVVDVGIADVYDAFEVIFVGDIDGG